MPRTPLSAEQRTSANYHCCVGAHVAACLYRQVAIGAHSGVGEIAVTSLKRPGAAPRQPPETFESA
jgi:hypothetical protein